MFKGVTTVFMSIIIPFKYALLTKREVVSMAGYMAKFLFLHFVRLSRSPLFFPGWLCQDTSSLAARPHALKLIFGHFSELMRGRLVASLAFCLPRRSRGQWEKNDTNIQLSWPKKLCQVMDLFYGQIIAVLIHNGLSCCYLVFYG